MNRRDAIKTIGGLAALPLFGTGVQAEAESLPVIQIKREVKYYKYYNDHPYVQRSVANPDEVMGEWTPNLPGVTRRQGVAWLNRDDALTLFPSNRFYGSVTVYQAEHMTDAIVWPNEQSVREERNWLYLSLDSGWHGVKIYREIWPTEQVGGLSFNDYRLVGENPRYESIFSMASHDTALLCKRRDELRDRFYKTSLQEAR